MPWHKGQPPKGTYYWGGIVEETSTPERGFHFADFHGDHVTLPMSDNRRVELHDIAYWNNDLVMPIKAAE